MNIRRLAESFFEGFGSSVKSVGLLSLAGALGGISLVLLGEDVLKAKGHEIAALVSEHLGLGFIVSSIAVFGYEWRAHSKKTLDLSDRLENLLVAQGEAALDRSLMELINVSGELPEGAEDVASNCKAVIMSISNLLESDRRTNIHYVGFISGLLRGVVKKNVQSLAKLCKKDTEDDEVPFRVPATAAVLADEMLAAQMNAMISGDMYEVISDLKSWKGDQLEHFQAATRRAVERGVKVRRIFNLIGGDAEEEISREDIEKILYSHLRAMDAWKGKAHEGAYEVRVFGMKELGRSGLDLSESQLKKHHFGIFNLVGGETIRFKVTKPDLSVIMISRDPNEVREERDVFSALWGVATPLSSEVIEKVVKEEEGQAERNAEKMMRRQKKEMVRKLGSFIVDRLEGSLAGEQGDVAVEMQPLGEKITYLNKAFLEEPYVAIRIKAHGSGQPRRTDEILIPQLGATLADTMLSSYMRHLREGDFYDAISDLGSWQGNRLIHFREETDEAINERGVTVRRVFHIFRDGASGFSSEDVSEVLAQHLKDAYRWSRRRGRYQVRFFGRSELTAALAADHKMDDLVQVEDFGIFTASGQKTRLKVSYGDVPSVRISQGKDTTGRDGRIFELIWEHSSELTQGIIDKLVGDLRQGA